MLRLLYASAETMAILMMQITVSGRLRQADSELSEIGFQQANLLGQYMKSGGFCTRFMCTEDTEPSTWTVVTSPMQRCLQTCKEVKY